MLTTSGGKGRERNLSSDRDIRKVGLYTPHLWSVVGSKEGGRKPPSPTTPKNQNPDESISLKGITEFRNFYERFLASINKFPLQSNFKALVLCPNLAGYFCFEIAHKKTLKGGLSDEKRS